MNSPSTRNAAQTEPAPEVGLNPAAGPHPARLLSGGVSHYRWVICALLFFATTINYMDRQIIALLKPILQREIGWDEVGYSNIIFGFQLAYAIGLLFAGKLMDWLGTRKGFSFSIVVWSLAAMGHSLAHSVFGFAAARFTLGLGEAGNFPACIKAVAEWFPKKERALATGIFNSGTNIGALITPLVVPWIVLHWQWRIAFHGRQIVFNGWRVAFISVGAVGFLWLLAWLAMYRQPDEHRRVTQSELEHIRGDAPEPVTKISWIRLLPHRQTWAFAIGKFLTDPIWWFYLFWAPDFLFKTFGVTLSNIGLPLFALYQMATIGSVGGGWLSSSLIKRGWRINTSRKTAMLICALAVVPVVFAPRVTHLWAAVALIGLALAAHQGWSANIFTIASDTFPRRAVGSVVGLGGMFGSLGALLLSKTAGYVLQWNGSYFPLFIIAGSAYLAALLIIHWLCPRLEPANIDAVSGTN